MAFHALSQPTWPTGLAPPGAAPFLAPGQSFQDAQPTVEVQHQVTLCSIRQMTASITLADPMLPDCPLIGCSEGFETITGWSKSEIVGRNCRFLNEGCDIDLGVMMKMRQAAIDGSEFIFVLPNRRKSGEFFQNLLHMTSIDVHGRRYIIGVQADVTDIDVDLADQHHVQALKAVAERVFSANLDAWIHMQAREFQIRLPMPYSEMLRRFSGTLFSEARDEFVLIWGVEVTKKNTFIHVKEGEAPGLKRSASDPLLPRAAPSSCQSNDMSTTEGPSNEESGTAHGSLGDRETSGDASGDESFAQAPTEQKSIGSFGHPDRCVECQFYFFGASGCRSGEDCLYCHNHHARKNSKKNRRFLRRIGGESREGQPKKEEPALPAVGDEPDAEAEVTEEAAPVDVAPPQPGGGASANIAALSYAEDVAPGDISHLILPLGQKVRRPAQVRAAPELRAGLRFSVTPDLPAGLCIDEKTGDISGTVKAAQPCSEHMVAASVEAFGPGGISLGMFPVVTCALSLRVEDLRNLCVRDIRESSAEGGLVVVFEAPAKPKVGSS